MPDLPLPGLPQVYERVKRLKGVVIRGKKLRPDLEVMEFKIAPGGRFYVKTPTAEMYISRKEEITWWPAKKELIRFNFSGRNPLPAGFEVLWPGGPNLLPNGKSQSAMFAGKPAVEIPCKHPQGYKVLLYVHPKSLLPLGYINTAWSKEREIRYLSVDERVITDREMTFVAPPDAKPHRGPR